MKLPIIQNRKTYFIFSGILIIITFLSLIALGLKPGIDFTGGSLLEVQFKERPETQKIEESLKEFDLGEINIQPSENDKVIIRFKDVNEDIHHNIITKLEEDYSSNIEAKELDSEIVLEKEIKEDNVIDTSSITITDEQGNPLEGVSIDTSGGDVISAEGSNLQVNKDVIELRFDSIGPVIGQELKTKSYKALIYVIIAIIIYVAWAFRQVSKPINSWKYGVIAVVALVHDVLITIGVFVFLGHFFGTEINTPFIAALLTILGYSVNDTIVVFDRVRENLHRYHEDFEETINDSVNETVTRSINTSVTTVFVLLAVYFFGGETIKDFVLALTIGMLAGTYSSIFIASPLLVTWQKLEEKFGK